jgi:hypothetical protein
MLVARFVGGAALLTAAGFMALVGLVALCGRSGRVVSPMALCPYAPGTAAVFLAFAGVGLGLGAWSLSMTRRPNRARWFVLAGLLVALTTAALG